MDSNLILLTDSYKVSHSKQYPKNTSYVYSYFESRGGEFDDVVFFGLQYLLKKYLCKGIEGWMIDEAQEYFDSHLGPGLFNRKGWEYI
jgi:nicotinamide phosphoribosyltransferase